MFVSILHHIRFPLFACLTALTGCGGMDSATQPNDGNIPAPEGPSGGGTPGNAADMTSPQSGGNQTAGGQSGGASGAAGGPVCYCGFGELAKARVVSAGADGECAVFELLEKPPGDDYYHDLNPGDRFGGHATALCEAGFDMVPETIVYVRYWPGDNDTSGCSEYQDCSQTECGHQPDPNSEVESPEFLDELADWDECNGQCVEDTRAACATHSEVARYSGKVTVAAVGEDDEVVFTWGQTYAVAPTDIAEANCSPEGVPQTVNPGSGGGENGGEAAPPPQPAVGQASVACDIPQ